MKSINTPVAVRKKTTFAGDVLKLVSGTTIAQIIGFLAMPILSRLYAPETWGLLALFTSITGILGAIACMRYELAILLPEKDEDAVNLLCVCLILSIVISILIVPLMWFGKPSLLLWLNAPELTPFLWLIPFMLLINGVSIALNYWNSRTHQFGRLSSVRVVNTITTTASKLGIAYVGYPTAGALIGATVVWQTIVTTVLAGQTLRDNSAFFRISLRLKTMLKVVKRFRKFPLVDFWGSLLNIFSNQAPFLLLSVYFTHAIVGYFSLANRLIYLPMTLIGGSISEVFFQRASQAYARNEDIKGLTDEIFKRLVSMSLLPSLLLMVIGKDLFVFVFGENWIEAGKYVQILAPWMFFWFVASPLTSLFAVTQRLESAFLVHLLLLASRIAPFVLSGAYCNVYLTLAIFSLTGTISYSFIGLWSMKLIGIKWRGTARTVVRIALRSSPAMALVLIIDICLGAPFWVVFLVAGIGLLEYAWYILRTEPLIREFKNSPFNFLRKHHSCPE